jgi:hypothetical protein
MQDALVVAHTYPRIHICVSMAVSLSAAEEMTHCSDPWQTRLAEPGSCLKMKELRKLGG